MAQLIFAHPYPDRSRANRALLAAVQDLPGVRVRSLYDLYPDFDIDVATEQTQLVQAELVIWQHPMHWYSVPSLLKHWFDKVLLRGWAYGDGGTQLKGKRCLWVTTTGGDEHAYSAPGMHAFPFSAFVPVIEQTARFCGMHWEEPVALHGAHRISDAVLATACARYRERVQALLQVEARAAAGENP
jgi:glutathione-regulated potassium-efflux system ancillary protein KefF